jgi:hypothetical protein
LERSALSLKAKTVYARNDIVTLAFKRRVERLVERKLKLVFVDNEGNLYELNEVNSSELAKGVEKISKETAKRLLLQKEQR